MNDPHRRPRTPNRTGARFDPARAWSEATRSIRANRDTLVVLAGLFFLVPQMLLTMFMPDVPQGLEGEAAANAALAIFGDWWPLLLAVALAQALGVLAVAVLLADRGRPTVREAMARGLRALPVYAAATLVLLAGVGLLSLMVLLPATLLAGEAGAGLALVPFFAAGIWVNVRTLPLAPAIAAEREGNPFEALQKSWRLTTGSGARLLMLTALFVLAAFVISVVATAVPGSLLIAALGQDTGGAVVGVIGAVVSSALMAVWSVLLVAIYRQLSA